MTPPSAAAQPVLVLDLGAQDAQLVARRLREAGAYSELVRGTISAEEVLERGAAGLVFTSGPFSVAAGSAPDVSPGLLELGIPVLAIGAGAHLLAHMLGGAVNPLNHREQGAVTFQITERGSAIFEGFPASFTGHVATGEAVSSLPASLRQTATSDSGYVAAFADEDRRLYGVHWLPELRTSEHGTRLFENFTRHIMGLTGAWNAESIVEEQVRLIREQVGSGRVLCALSGGVDSAVAAALVHRAVGDQLTCVFVDHGLLREGEREQVEIDYVRSTGVRLITVDARERFLGALAGVSDPETKRKIIGTEFIRVFEATQADL